MQVTIVQDRPEWLVRQFADPLGGYGQVALGQQPAEPGSISDRPPGTTLSFDNRPWAAGGWTYPILCDPLADLQVEQVERLVCPTQAAAEQVYTAMGVRPGVIRLGAPTVRPYNPHAREFGREELRQALWDLPDDRTIVLAEPGRHLPEILAGCPSEYTTVVLSEPSDDIQALADLNDRQVLFYTGAKTLAGYHTVFNAADLYIPDHTWSPTIELAMACGCVPAVPDLDLWSERVDMNRGVELPTYWAADQGVSYRFDPSGIRQVLSQLTVNERRIRRANGLAWAADPANSMTRKAEQWATLLFR